MDRYTAQTSPGGSTAFSGGSPEAFGAGVARGIGDVSEAVGQIEERRKARNRDSELAAAGLEFATISTELDRAEIEARDNAAPGAAGHSETIDKLADDRINKALGQIRDPKVRDSFKARYADLRGNVSNRAFGWERAAHTKHMVSNVRETTRTLANGQATNPDGIGYEVSRETIKTVWENLDVAPAIKAEGLREDLRELALAGGQAWADREPEAFLGDGKNGGVLGQLTPDLNPEDVDRLRQRAQAELASLEAKRNRQAAVWESRRRDEIQAIGKRIIDFGDYDTIGEKDWETIAADVKKFNDGAGDKTLELDVGKWRDLWLTGKSTKGYTPVDWKREIGKLEGKDKLSTEEAIRLDNLRTLRTASEAKFNNNPDEWANNHGDPMPAIDWENAGAADGSARVAWAERIIKQGGKPFVLDKGELTTFQGRIRDGGAAGAIDVAQTLRTKFGVSRGSLLAIEQIGGDTAQLKLMLGLPAHTAKDYKVGADVLKSGGVKISNDVIAEAWGEYKTAVPEDAQPSVLAAARNIAAAELNRSPGEQDEDQQRAALRKALHRAVGATGTNGGFVEWGHDKLLIPPEMPKDEATRRLSRVEAPGLIAAAGGEAPYYRTSTGKLERIQGRAVDFLSRGRLETTGTPGVYRVLLEDGGHVATKGGGYWQFDIRKIK